MPLEGSESPLPAGLIICAMREWLCFAIRILVISRVKAARSSTGAFASASGLSRTMAMSISPPSFWMRAGWPACILCKNCHRLVFAQVRPFLQCSLRQGASFVVGPLELLVFLCSDEGPGRQCGRRQVCDTVAAT